MKKKLYDYVKIEKISKNQWILKNVRKIKNSRKGKNVPKKLCSCMRTSMS